MTINRANQTWPSDVTTDLSPTYICPAETRPHVGCNGSAPCLMHSRSGECEMEYERRQRGSASTIAALAVVTLFIIFAVAAMPLINSLGVK